MNRRTGSVLLLAGCIFAAEIIDRIAVTVGRDAITLSAIDEQIRVAAFLSNEPVKLNAASRRLAAERMIEQSLLRQEMEFSRFALPDRAAVDPVFEKISTERFRSEDETLRALASYGLTAKTVREHLRLQIAILRFIEVRFRPTIAVGDAEIEIYYREQFVPEAEKSGNGPVPTVEEVSDKIERILIQEKTDQALNAWLREARAQIRVAFIEEALQ